MSRYAQPGAAVGIVCFTADQKQADRVGREFAERLDTIGIDTHLLLWADETRWADLVTGDMGLQSNAARERVATMTVLAGRPQPAATRDSLAQSLVGDREPVATLLTETRTNTAASTVHAECHWAVGRVQQFESDGVRLDNPDAARLLVAVEAIPVRDQLWLGMNRSNAVSHAALWTDMTKRAPDEVRTAPASLLAFGSWLSGDGAMAWCALDQVPEGKPYALANLVAAAIESGMHPREWADANAIPASGAAQAPELLPSRTTPDNPTRVPVGESSRVVFPLPSGTWVKTSNYGMRLHPITGIYKLHSGVDFAAPSGTPIFAAADGVVASAGPSAGNGNLILIEHTVAGQPVATGYAHMTEASIMVRAGDRVTAGQQIASVGSTGYATGPHLHFELRPGGANAATADPVPWLNAQGAVALATGTPSATGECGPDGDATTYNGDNPTGMVDDPTTTGNITQRTAHILAQVRQQFPNSSWSCFSPRPGQTSEHSLGRACDGTFGNSIGVAAQGPALDLGWKVTNWIKANAETLGVQYLIWQGKIWSVARSAEGWRPYNGGGMHDPASITGGHYDHLHFTAKP